MLPLLFHHGNPMFVITCMKKLHLMRTHTHTHTHTENQIQAFKRMSKYVFYLSNAFVCRGYYAVDSLSNVMAFKMQKLLV